MFVGSLVIGTRRSQLARVQSELIGALIRRAQPKIKVDLLEIVTEGDRTQAAGIALPSIGGKGLFTQELEAAILTGKADIAVHSLKDLPTLINPDLIIGAIPPRSAVGDVLVSRDGRRFADLPANARVGTSSLRRETQLRRLRPELEYLPIRGNVDTRVNKVKRGEYDACVVAEAGLERLNLKECMSDRFSVEDIMPAPGQGALAVQCARNRSDIVALLAGLDHLPTRLAVTAERAFLARLNAGCSTPLAAIASMQNGNLNIRVRAVSRDGKNCIELDESEEKAECGVIESAQKLGERIADRARAQGILEI